MALPAFAIGFFKAVLKASCHLGYLLVARKNSKSASLACLVLAYLADGGPLRRAGFRCAIVSITKLKAGELKKQIQDIAEASGLRGLEFPKSPAPGRVVSRWGSAEILSAQDYEGHASGFDLVLIDELGLLSERYRPLINGLKSSLLAKRGRLICLSIRGSSPFTTEALALSTHPGVVVHHHAANNPTCAIDDEVQLRAANPGIASGIITLEDLVRDAKIAQGTPNEGDFRAHHLNLKADPAKELICTASAWQRCVVKLSQLPPREGPCFLGLDPGGSSSLTAACIIFKNGRTEFFAALPDTPNLAERGVSDGVGSLYTEAAAAGELRVFSGRVTPVADFLASVIHELADVDIIGGCSDRYRRAEILQVIEAPETEVGFPWTFSAMGSGERGSADVRSFQKLVLRAEIKTRANLLFAHGLSSAVIRRDGNGNPALERSGKGRIDLVSAAVLSAGLKFSHGDSTGFSISQVPF